MANTLMVVVKESMEELEALEKEKFKPAYYYKRIGMLILIKKSGSISKDALAEKLNVSDKSVHLWRTKYNMGGLEMLLKNKRRGRQSGMTSEIYEELRDIIQNEGFDSLHNTQLWFHVNDLILSYQATHVYMKRHFGGWRKKPD